MSLNGPVKRHETKPPPRLRRHSSFHVPTNYPLPSRPQQNRLVSFSTDPPKSARGTFSGPSTHRCSRSRNQSSNSSECSHTSSLSSNGSGTLVSSPTNYFDSKCAECGMPPLELDILPPFSNFVSNFPPAPPSSFLRKLPNMKATFKRRGSSVVSVSTTSDYEKSERRRTSMDSPPISVSGTDSPRSILLHPYMSSGCKTAPPTAAGK